MFQYYFSLLKFVDNLEKAQLISLKFLKFYDFLYLTDKNVMYASSKCLDTTHLKIENYCLPPFRGRSMYLGVFALFHQNRMNISKTIHQQPKNKPRFPNGGRQ